MEASELRPLEDPLVQQLMAIVVEQLADLGGLTVLADRLEELGEDLEAEWVRRQDLEQVVECASEDLGANIGNVADAGEVLDVWFAASRCIMPPEQWVKRLGLPEIGGNVDLARLERSVVFELVRRVYSSAAQEAVLEAKYHRKDEGPYPPEEGHDYWGETLNYE